MSSFVHFKTWSRQYLCMSHPSNKPDILTVSCPMFENSRKNKNLEDSRFQMRYNIIPCEIIKPSLNLILKSIKNYKTLIFDISKIK